MNKKLFAPGCDNMLNPWQLLCTQKLKSAVVLHAYLKKVSILCLLDTKCDLSMKNFRTVLSQTGLVELQELTIKILTCCQDGEYLAVDMLHSCSVCFEGSGSLLNL